MSLKKSAQSKLSKPKIWNINWKLLSSEVEPKKKKIRHVEVKSEEEGERVEDYQAIPEVSKEAYLKAIREYVISSKFEEEFPTRNLWSQRDLKSSEKPLFEDYEPYSTFKNKPLNALHEDTDSITSQVKLDIPSRNKSRLFSQPRLAQKSPSLIHHYKLLNKMRMNQKSIRGGEDYVPLSTHRKRMLPELFKEKEMYCTMKPLSPRTKLEGIKRKMAQKFIQNKCDFSESVFRG
ncbi:unnamed protein product [Moneuplotes crassus]|uniref:Uncharacterized protein n=1 Tax=Euplotes crassus TaxID=5936 RepID=A0AAD1XRE3_EUPCR|nr:unnamed protein product [Moneuplotes crassus]